MSIQSRADASELMGELFGGEESPMLEDLIELDTSEGDSPEEEGEIDFDVDADNEYDCGDLKEQEDFAHDNDYDYGSESDIDY